MGLIDRSISGVAAFDEGFIDYDDSLTSGTPISLLSGVDTALTNDGLGADTFKGFAPATVADVWLSNAFDFTDLSVGSEVGIRLDVIVTTLTPNTDLSINLLLGGGLIPFTIPFMSEQTYKSAGAHSINVYNRFYIKDSNALNGYGKFMVTADSAATAVVNGWYVSIKKRL